MKNKLFTALCAGLLNLVSLNAMDTAPEKKMQVRTFSDAESGAIREARASVKPDFFLRKTAHQFERQKVSSNHMIFKGLSYEKSSICASDCFERYIKEGDEQKVAATLKKYPRFAQAHPLARSLFDVATNKSDMLNFDQKQNPNISYMEAMNIAISFAFDGDNQNFLDNHPIEYQALYPSTNSSSSSSREEYSNSDDF